ncbi:MAG: response regulator [Planctomycetia bacterium]|nr:response regulator [Planctomycetia bacterium]
MIHIKSSQTVILVIDDEPASLEQIAAILEQAGHACHCAQDAAAAQECIERATPDLIISDINLAGHSGLTLCDQLKQQFGLTDVPVMFLSAAQTPDIIRRSHADGGTYYLRKPFDSQVLLELIGKARLARHLSAAH